MDNRIRSVLILGGGTAGWMSAAALSSVLGDRYCDIRLVESDAIGTIGVGEATIPQIVRFNSLLGIDENELLRETQGTFKLGIEFVDWGRIGDRYIHPFGVFGAPMNAIPFHQYWLKLRQLGRAADLQEFSLACLAAPEGKFTRPVDLPKSPLAQIAYAYQFDANLYARYLRNYAEARGVQRTEGKITDVQLRPDDGFVKSVTLESGESLEADLFIDCSGFRGLLIEEALATGYEDWSHLLPCDRAIAIPSRSVGPPLPYTRATAQRAGWQWRIPLQHRVGNGHVYCSEYLSDDEARSILLENMDGESIADPRLLKFNGGRRKKFWNKNVVAIGLSSGFLEPLESTSIYLIQSAISKLIGLFPSRNFDQIDIDKFNDQSRDEIEFIRDFLVLHYNATERDDSEFWNYCRNIDVPDTLRDRMQLFKSNGRLFREAEELFSETSWLAVFMGQRHVPNAYHPIVDVYDTEVVARHIDGVREVIRNSVDSMPAHDDYISKNCAAVND